MPYAVSVTSLMPPGAHKIVASVEYPQGHPLPPKTFTVRIDNPYYGKAYADPELEALKKENPDCSVVLLQQGHAAAEWKIDAYAGCEDTELHAPCEIPDRSMGAVNFGAAPSLAAGFYVMEHRLLIKFDIAALPQGSKIVKAVMLLHLQQGGVTGLNTHRMLKDWKQGIGIGSLYDKQHGSRPGECTWLHRAEPELNWGAPGGKEGEDYDASFVTGVCAEAKNGAGKQEQLVWVRWGVTELAQRWAASSADNHGVILIGADKNLRSTFRSSEYEDPLFRPKLLIVYR